MIYGPRSLFLDLFVFCFISTLPEHSIHISEINISCWRYCQVQLFFPRRRIHFSMACVPNLYYTDYNPWHGHYTQKNNFSCILHVTPFTLCTCVYWSFSLSPSLSHTCSHLHSHTHIHSVSRALATKTTRMLLLSGTHRLSHSQLSIVLI